MIKDISDKLPHYGFEFLRCDIINDVPHKTYAEWEEICPHCADKGQVHSLLWDEEVDDMNPYECPACLRKYALRDLKERFTSIPCTWDEFEGLESERRQKFWLTKRYGTTPEHIGDFWMQGCAS